MTRELPGFDQPFPISPSLRALVDTVLQAGGKPVAVGGCVRDHLLGLSPKDIDVEVYNIALNDLEAVLTTLGDVHAVGKSFGVLKVSMTRPEIANFDVSLPRRENKEGRGHKGFFVEMNSNLSFEDASLRRDFTVNAMGIDLETSTLLDPHSGVRDLRQGILRHVSEAFDEDPLRVLRAAQFAARFALSLDPGTIKKCQNLRSELSTLPKERIWEEFKKLIFAARPSIGLEVLQDTGALELFPELLALMGCQQDPTWHPEGDVWVHTLMVADEAARIVREEQLDEDESLKVLFGALCHDLGKPPTTKFEDGRYRSKNHEAAGEEPTRSFLSRVGAPNDLIDAVVPLVRDHLKPVQLYKEREKISDGAIRRLSARVPITRLCLVAKADFLGRTTEDAKAGIDPSVVWLLREASRLSVQNAAPRPILMGRHLLDAGMTPGPQVGEILAKAYEAQLDGEFSDLDNALKWVKLNSR